MGGDFGFATSSGNYAGGLMTGLAKSIRREFPSLRTHVIDVDGQASDEEIASIIRNELYSPAADLEVGYRQGRRYVVQAVSTQIAATRPDDILSGGVWIITGGGRGVTSQVARALGEQFGVKLHLLGTAPAPNRAAPWHCMNAEQLKQFKRDTAIGARKQGLSPVDAWRKIEKDLELAESLQKFSDASASAAYHCCDITDQESLAGTLHAIRLADGPICGIVHGAGVEAACRFGKKKDSLVRATIASKCDGAANLIRLTENDPLRYFVAFGSTSGRFGGLGQTDYSLASDLLAKMMGQLAHDRSECKSICFHWPAWDEVGMAARPESRVVLEQAGMTFMPVREGISHVIGELGSDSNEHEILILDTGRFLDTDGTMSRQTTPEDANIFRTVTPGNPVSEDPVSENSASESPASVSPLPAATQTSNGSPTISSSTAQPLIKSFRQTDEPGRMEAEMILDAVNDPFLSQHRFRGAALLPGVISLEAFAEAAQFMRPDAQFLGFSDVQFSRGFAPRTDMLQSATVRMTEVAGGVKCELVSPLVNLKGAVVEAERVYASAVVEYGSVPAYERVEIAKPVFGWFPFVYPSDMPMFHGSPFQTFHGLSHCHGGGWGKISAGQTSELFGSHRSSNSLTPSAAIDGCMVACGFYAFAMVDEQICLPACIERYRQVRSLLPDEACFVQYIYREEIGNRHVFDFKLLDESGDVVIAVEGYRADTVAE